MPAVFENVVFGTAGWTDPSLIRSRSFYPRGHQKPEQRLRYYANHFAMVEVDASYYTILAPEVSRRWVTWTPESFRFNIKAHSSLTGHPIDLAKLPKPLRQEVEDSGLSSGKVYDHQLPSPLLEQIHLGFEAFVRPLQQTGRLGCIMLQFPPWFLATRGNARHLEVLRERWGDFRLSIEFRHPSWLAPERRGRVFDLLKRLQYCYVAVDEPDVRGGGVPPLIEVTNPELALVRFHGHNIEAWRRGAAVAQRYDYLYGESELRRWVAPTQQLAERSQKVHAIFNNCVRDYAILNAKNLSVLVRQGAPADETMSDEG